MRYAGNIELGGYSTLLSQILCLDVNLYDSIELYQSDSCHLIVFLFFL